MPDPLFTPFALKYGEHTDDLEQACIRIGGIKSKEGDLSYEFTPFFSKRKTDIFPPNCSPLTNENAYAKLFYVIGG